MSTVTSPAATLPTTSQATVDALNARNGAVGGQQTLGQNDFLKLLTVQLSSQDPLKPMDDTQFISQMATFSSLSQMQTLSQNFSTFSQQQAVTNANNYLGKDVTVKDKAAGSVTGMVTSVAVSSGTPQLIINGNPYDLSAVTGVHAGATVSNAGSTAQTSN